MSEKDVAVLGIIRLAEFELAEAVIALDEGKRNRASACLAKAREYARDAEMVCVNS